MASAWGNSWGQVGEIAKPRHTGGGDDSHVDLVKLREGIKRAQEERDRLEAERLAEVEREASEVLARIASANEPEPSEPVVIPIPESIEPEQVAQVEPLAPVNDLVTANVQNSPVSIQVSDDVQSNATLSDNDTIALLLILAEID